MMTTPASTLTQIELKSAIVRNPILVTGETTVMAAISLMSGVRAICAADDAEGYADNVHQEARSSCVLVMAGETVRGILTERDVVRLSAQQRSLDEVTVQEVMASPVIALRETEFTDLFSAVNLLQQRRIRHLPILDRDQRLLGILTHESLRQLARPVDLLRLRLVSEVMTSKVMCAEPSTSMLAIAQLMAERRVGSILIVEHRLDPEGQPLQIPVGIITERDIVQFQSLGMNLALVEVQVVMSTPVFSVRPEDSLMVVQEVMEQRSIRRLVVTGTQGELLGIVTQTSLLQALNPLELYTLSKILEEKVSLLEAEKVRLMANYTAELERQVAQRTAELNIKAEREQLMAKVAVKIAASRSLPEVLDTTVQELRSLLRCDRMVIWQFQPDWSGVIVAESVDEGWRASLHDPIDDPCFRGDLVESYTAGRILATANIHTAGYPPCYIQLLEQYQVKSNLVVPICVSEGLWGLLIGHQCCEYRDWQAADLTVLDEMAVQIAIAIQQAMAYQQAQAELLERQRAEMALQQTEKRFRAIFDNTFQFIGLLSPEGIVLEANQAALTAGGLLLEDVVGRPFWETYWWQISPETQAQLRQAIAQAAQGQFVRYEVKVWGINQTIIPMDFSLRPLFDAADRVVLLIPEGRDLREVKRQELELKQSEQRYAALAQSAPVGIFRTDEVGHCLYVNDRWCQIARLTVAEAAGFGWVNGIHPDDRELVATEWNASVEEERPFSLEYRFQNREGQITWAYGQAVSMQDDTGETIGYVGTVTDISDRKQTELALIQSEARSSAILDAIPDLMFRVGGDGVYRELSRLEPQIDVLGGLDPVGLMMADILPGELAARNLHYIDRAITTGELQIYEQQVWIGDRQQIEEVRVVRSGDNEALLMIRDISDRKLAEQFLQIQRDFNQLIAEITSRFVDLSPEDLDTEIDRTLQLIAEITQVDTSYLIKLDEVAGTMSMTHEWSQPSSLRQIAIAQDMPLMAFPWSISLLRQREVIHVPSVQGLPVVAAMDKAGWQQYNLVAVLQVPLVQKSVVTGLMGFASFSQVMTWDDETIRLLQVMGQTIANAQERAQDEQQLYESEERLRLALAAANQGLYDLNLQTGETVVSPEYATMLGYDPNTFEETNAKWLERLHPDDLSTVASTFKAYVTGTRPDYKVEFRQRTASGEWQWVLSIGKIVEWDAAGEPLRMLGTHTDIGDRKQAELALQQLNQELETKVAQRTAALQASEATNRATLEAIPDLLLRLRRDGTCLEYIQPAHQSNTFLPITNHLAEVLPPDLLHNHLQMTERAIATGELQVYEHQFLKYGRMVYEEVRTVAINQDEVLAIVRDVSDRKRAEQQLKNQLAAIEAAVDGIGILQGEHYIYLNSAHLSLFGYDRPEEIVGQSWKRLYTDEELFRFEREVFPRLRHNGHWSGEATAIRKDGTTFAEELSLTLTDEGLLICVCRDISDRKQAEQELLESQQFIEKIAEASPNIIYLYDLQERRSVYSNRQISSVLGYTPLEIQVMGADFFANLMHPDDLANMPDHFAQIGAADDETIFELEYRMRHADGEWRWLYSRSSVFSRDDRGHVKLTIGTVQDVSDRKQTETALQNLSDRLSLALKSGAIGIWDWNIAENSLTWDDRMYELYGITPAQLTNIDVWSSSLHPDDRSSTEAAVQQALAGEKDYDPEFRVIHADSSVRFIQAYALVQRNDEGLPQRMIGINFDITDRKQAERNLLRTSAQLEASNRELEAFAYSVSHDLRGPLRAIDGFSMALMEDYADQFGEEGQDYFARIRHNVNRMGMLIDDLLRLSRVSRSDIQYSTVNLSILVQEQIEELQAMDPDRQVTVVIAPDAIVSADATLMRVLLTNLIQNAWKFTSHHATARIEFGLFRQDEDWVYFVRDDGAGFDMAYADMLFGVFQRLHNTHEFPGTGIGLATVQRAIHRHGGCVWAEGVVEQGATVYFTLPNILNRPRSLSQEDAPQEDTASP